MLPLFHPASVLVHVRPWVHGTQVCCRHCEPRAGRACNLSVHTAPTHVPQERIRAYCPPFQFAAAWCSQQAQVALTKHVTYILGGQVRSACMFLYHSAVVQCQPTFNLGKHILPILQRFIKIQRNLFPCNFLYDLGQLLRQT